MKTSSDGSARIASYTLKTLNVGTLVSALCLLHACATWYGPTDCGDQAACAVPDCTGHSCSIYLMNQNPYPISMGVTIKTKNVVTKNAANQVFVLAPGERRKLSGLYHDDLYEVSSVAVESIYTEGSYLSVHDDRYVYALPFEKGKRYLVSQGYDGPTHKGPWKYSIDFMVPEGGIVTAAREGQVIGVADDNDKGCFEERCESFANYVSILHSDGTIAKYAHLKRKGVLVTVGENVPKGAKIGLAGNTGMSSGAHLHFMVFKPKNPTEYETVPIAFETKEGVFKRMNVGESYTAK